MTAQPHIAGKPAPSARMLRQHPQNAFPQLVWATDDGGRQYLNGAGCWTYVPPGEPVPDPLIPNYTNNEKA